MYNFCIPYRPLVERPEALENCLKRLYNVLAIDNRSAEEITISIGGQDQIGKFNRSAALNEAIKKAKYSCIITLDVDLVLPENFLDQIEIYLKPNTVLGFIFEQNGIPLFPGTPGGCTVFYRAVWGSVGGYCEEYGGYGWEDYDFRNRIEDAGFSFITTPIKISHLPHPQVQGIYEDLERNKQIYLKKWPNGRLPG